MSGLASVLAGHTPVGAYRWESGLHAGDVRHAVEQAGWHFGLVEGWRVGDRAELFGALDGALGLRGLHGRNLDALEECVRDLPGRAVLLWEGWGPLAREHERLVRGVLDVLTDTTDRPGTCVLLRGDGPDLDVPLLD